jgi:hypothetical protein
MKNYLLSFSLCVLFQSEATVSNPKDKIYRLGRSIMDCLLQAHCCHHWGTASSKSSKIPIDVNPSDGKKRRGWVGGPSAAMEMAFHQLIAQNSAWDRTIQKSALASGHGFQGEKTAK